MAYVNHTLCDPCWKKREPNREPVRVRDTSDYRISAVPCCACGVETRAGIFVRGSAYEYKDCRHNEVSDTEARADRDA